MKCTSINPEGLDAFWQQIKPLLEKVTPETYGRENSESIKDKIKNKEILLWILWEDITDIKGVVATKIIEYPYKKVCWWGFMGAKDNQINSWFSVMVKTLSEYSIKNNCEYIEFMGRKGWQKQFLQSNVKLINIGITYEGKLV